MNSPRLTNALLLIIALALAARLGLALAESPAVAETFKLDSCITQTLNEKPIAYLHVVTHGMADTDLP